VVKQVLLVVAAALALAGCSDSFQPPELPDLSKDPYDFAVKVPPYVDLGAGDGPRDMGNQTD
jgi:hypothetical protein